MSANYTPEKEDLKILTPFKMQVLTNFPYIEADFDALTNYQLLCKIVEYLNEVIAETNEVTERTLSLYNAYVALENYVNNYFDNLDLSEEVSKKLDEMAEDGTLTNLIKSYVDPIFESYESDINLEISNFKEQTNQEISTFEDSTDVRLTNLQTMIGNLKSGTPIPVNDVALMTDTDEIYLNTTDGKWYYYDGDSWEIGGDYAPATISENSITTIDVKRLDIMKLVNNGFYVKQLTNHTNTLTVSDDGSLISFTAESGQVIPATSYCGFDMYIPITKEMAENGGIVLLNKITGNNDDLVILLPQVSYISTSNYNQDDYYYSTKYNTASLTTYLTNHIGEMLQLRICFTNTSGISLTFENMYIKAYKGENYVDNFSNIIGKEPTLQVDNNLNVPYNYDKVNKQFAFHYTSQKGLLYSVPQFDPTKDLNVYVNTISGTAPDVFLKYIDNSSQAHYYALSLTNSKVTFTKEYFANISNGINDVQIILACADNTIIDTNYRTATINYPIITQNPYSYDYIDTLYKISINNRLYNNRLLVLGDSMARGHTLNRSYVWDSLISSRNCMTLVNLAANGKFYTRHEFVDGHVTAYTQEDLDEHTVTNIGLVDMIDDLDTNTDYIVVFCGTNDMYQHITLGEFLDNNYTTFYGCLYKTFNSLISKYPVEKILIITPYPRTTSYTNDMNYINAINEVAKYFCIPVYNTYEAGLCIKNTYQAAALLLDDTHLNQAGQLRQSYKIEEQMKSL